MPARHDHSLRFEFGTVVDSFGIVNGNGSYPDTGSSAAADRFHAACVDHWLAPGSECTEVGIDTLGWTAEGIAGSTALELRILASVFEGLQGQGRGRAWSCEQGVPSFLSERLNAFRRCNA